MLLRDAVSRSLAEDAVPAPAGWRSTHDRRAPVLSSGRDYGKHALCRPSPPKTSASTGRPPTARCVPSTGISFAFDEGTLNVLLGPSGCGKSTTLRLIAGLEPADAGRIFIAGRDVTDLPPAQRNIAMVFQSYALFPHLPVAENIVFGLKVRERVARRTARCG